MITDLTHQHIITNFNMNNNRSLTAMSGEIRNIIYVFVLAPSDDRDNYAESLSVVQRHPRRRCSLPAGRPITKVCPAAMRRTWRSAMTLSYSIAMPQIMTNAFCR